MPPCNVSTKCQLRHRLIFWTSHEEPRQPIINFSGTIITAFTVVSFIAIETLCCIGVYYYDNCISLVCHPFLQDTTLMNKLFGPLRERYMTRPGGFTRVLKAPNRKGDNAPMAVVELVGNR